MDILNFKYLIIYEQNHKFYKLKYVISKTKVSLLINCEKIFNYILICFISTIGTYN